MKSFLYSHDQVDRQNTTVCRCHSFLVFVRHHLAIQKDRKKQVRLYEKHFRIVFVPSCHYPLCLRSIVQSQPWTMSHRSSDSIAEYRRQQATSASPQPCTLKQGSTMFLVRQNKAMSCSFVPNSAPLYSARFPLPTTKHH